MINHDHRFIFVHIPKTAGNSVNRVFGVKWEDHKDLAAYAAQIPEELFKRYYKFAIVRNPWARMLSDYNYQVKKSRPAASKLFLFDERGEKRRFRAWLEAVLADPFHYDPSSWGGAVSSHIHRWSPQVDWISLNGTMAVDKVIPIERLDSGFNEVCQSLGLRAPHVPHRNGRFHWHYSWYYDDGARDLVAQYYAKDIEAFGYSFSPCPGRRLWSGLGRIFSSIPATPAPAFPGTAHFAPVAPKRAIP